jgi:hypothetical protein
MLAFLILGQFLCWEDPAIHRRWVSFQRLLVWFFPIWQLLEDPQDISTRNPEKSQLAAGQQIDCGIV